MAKYIIDSETLTGLANALRNVTGESRSYTPTEMIEAVTTIMDSAMYILVDENGNEIPAVFVENETRFDATANDIRLGKVAATADGVTVGEKEIPSYNTTEGFKLIPAGSDFVIPLTKGKHEYTKLQAILCPFNISLDNSVAAEKVVIGDHVYSVRTASSESTVTVTSNPNVIDLGVTNESAISWLIRYFTYKEIY